MKNKGRISKFWISCILVILCAQISLCITNCASDDGNNNCLECDSGYMRTITSPIACTSIQNCQTYLTDTEGCSVCNENYLLTLGQPPLCQYVSPPPTCYGKSSSCSIPHCTTIDSTTMQSCTTCDSGYYKTIYSSRSLNTIIQCSLTENCAVYDGQYQTCVACADGYYFKNGKPPQCLAVIAHCKTYIDKLSCKECESGYYIQDNAYPTADKCVQSDYCSSSSGTTCTACIDGFYLDTASSPYTCKLGSIPGCKVYASSTSCTTCDSTNYFTTLSALSPAPNKCNTGWYKLKYQTADYDTASEVCSRTDNCRVINQNLWCTLCSDYYALKYSTDSNPCEPTCEYMTGQADEIENCVSYGIRTNCIICESGYYILDEDASTHSSCTQTEHCLTATTDGNGDLICSKCKNGYWLNTGGSVYTCEEGTITNCEVYDNDNSGKSCSSCASSYQLVDVASISSGTTDMCFETLYCSTADISSSYNSSNYCQSCSSGYYLFEMMLFSDTYMNPRQCLSLTGYTPITNCILYKNYGTQNNFNKLVCLECQSGYYPLNNSQYNKGDQCTQTQYCRIAGTDDVCTGCIDYYYLDSTASPLTCNQYITGTTELISNCMTYDDSDPTNICVACKSGYYVVDQTTDICSQTANCSTSGTDGICTACLSGFCLIQTSSPYECREKIRNCADPDAFCTECTTCLSGFYRLDNTGTASDQCTLTEHCKTADSDDVCTDCETGYTIDTSGTVVTCTA